MRSVSVEGVEVHDQLHALRRRLNGLTAQRAVAIGSAGLTLIAAAVIVLALRASPSWFAVASWGGVAIAGGLATYLPWRAYRAWLSLDDTAHLADQQSGLDGRLTTLLADPAPNSPLRDLLVHQVRAATPRWHASVLAPRRVAPLVALVPASLAVLAVACFLARPPARAALSFQPWQQRPGTLTGGADAETLAAVASATADGGQDGKASPHAAAAQSGAAGRGGGDNEGDAGTALGSGQGGEDAARAGGEPSAGSDGLRDAIRQAMGADDDATEKRQANGGHNNPGSGDATSKAQPDPTRDRLAAANPPSESAGARQPGAPPAPDTAGGNQPGGSARDGHGGTQRAGAGGQAGGLYAEAPAAAAGGSGEAKPMAIKLGAFAAAAPQHAEPQRRVGPITTATTTSAGNGGAAPLSLTQAPDAALQKLDLAPEHESIVRRIFTRE